MKTIRNTITLFLALSAGTAMAQKPRTLVMNMAIDGVRITPRAAGSMLKIEAQKTAQFITIDKMDVSTSDSATNRMFENCHNIDCLVKAGVAANTEKVLSGSVQHLGNKIAVTIKLIDVKSGVIEKTEIGEYVLLENEI